MKIKKNKLVGAGVLLISLLLILSSGISIADTVDKNPEEATSAIDSENIEIDFKIDDYGASSSQRVTCYGSNLHKDPDDNLVWFYSDTPGEFNHIAGITTENFLAGGCIAGEFGDNFWWACEYSDVGDSKIWQIDEVYGAMYEVGNAGVGLNGLAYDPITETLYGCGNEELFTINQNTGEATMIGAFNTGGLMIGIACDENGKMYGEDIDTDSLYEINTLTGEATLIGALGIDITEAQDIAYDKDHDVLYSTGYKGTTNGGGALGTLDLTDGHYTFIGDFPIGEHGVPSQVACLAIPYGAPNVKPEKPEIAGPPSGPKQVELNWTFHSDDPNGDVLKYFIDWGDGSNETTDCYPSCTPVTVSHTYAKTGKYDIRAYAKECDTEEEYESETTTFGVAIPRARSAYHPLFLRIFERFPNTFLIFRALLGI